MMRKISRRDFLKGSAAGAASLAFASVFYGMGQGTALAEEAEAGVEASEVGVLDSFLNPDYKEKPMVRWWFPDAGAGDDENDKIEESINALAEAGYGGAEVTMMLSGTRMTNEELADYGWGSENWKKLLKKVLTTANAVEGGFTADITITAHWPTVINSIDPNDAAASKEIISTVQKVYGAGEDIELTLPDMKTMDSPDALTAAPFIFTDTLVDAYLVKVADKVEVENMGMGGFPGGEATESTEETEPTYSDVYDFDSAINVTDLVTSVFKNAAGVPDEETCSTYGLDYSLVEQIFGEAPADDADLSASYNGKMDADGHRARMQDEQYAYSLSTTEGAVADALAGYAASDGDDTEIGDYVLISVYERGTGQIMSDGPFGGASDAMYSRTYVTNYFNEDGVDVILQYWEQNILDDELRALLEENGSCIFEDSIEAGTKSGGSFWSNAVKDKFSEDFTDTYTDKVALVVSQGSSSFSSATEGLSENIVESYQMTLGDLYDTAHSEKISEWAATFNYKYRAQCYAITGQDICSSAMSVDIPEGDNSSKGDGLRKMASVVNVGNKESFSMEAVTATGNLKMNWADVVTEVAQNFSDGVNHVVLHGYPYVKTVNGYYSDWPGWTAFGNNFAGSYAHWRCDWEDMDLLAGYIARNQAVLQSGTAKVDLAVLNDTTTGASLSDGNTFQQLLDHGYSYNMFTEALMESDQAVVTNSVLAESGPAYKALIVNAVSVISAEGMAKVLEYANAGLPVILYNCNISDIYGLSTDTNSQELLLDSYDELTVLDNVMTASTEDEIEEILAAMEVQPAASYSASKLETSHYVDEIDGSDFYYMYNNVVPSNTGMSNGKNSEYKEGETIETTVTLTGNGVPYKLDAWTGTAEQLAEYTVNEDGSYSFDVTLSGGDSVIYAILSGREEQLHIEVSDGSADYTEDGTLVYKSNEAGTVTVALSDGTEQEVTIAQTLDSAELTNGWSLTLESWGPADEYYADENIDTERTEKSSTGDTVYVDPTLSKVTTEEFAIDTLGNWADIDATEEQLENLGVESMQFISGVGYYTNTFSLPDSWDETTGAVLVLEYSQVMVTEVTVNGTTIRGINNASDQVDIGAYLQNGENTITVKIDSPMYNRMRGEERIAIMDTSGMNMTGQETINTGLLSVTLNPYTMVALS